MSNSMSDLFEYESFHTLINSFKFQSMWHTEMIIFFHTLHLELCGRYHKCVRITRCLLYYIYTLGLTFPRRLKASNEVINLLESNPAKEFTIGPFRMKQQCPVGKPEMGSPMSDRQMRIIVQPEPPRIDWGV